VIELKIIAQIIAGAHGDILLRQKSGEIIELGELLVTENDANEYQILQVYDLLYGSQISSKMTELIAGMKLEGKSPDLSFMDADLRNYILARVKALITVKNKEAKVPKTLPNFMNSVREVTKEDLQFLVKPERPLYLGKVRSGSKILSVPVYIDSDKAFAHHILISATTGRGKSNLVKVMVYDSLSNNYSGILVLDPHDEYYGRKGLGLKDHPNAHDNLVYYTPKSIPGGILPIINISSIKPWHFTGIINLTQAQEEALYVAYNKNEKGWIADILRRTELENVDPKTITVLIRKLNTALGMYINTDDGTIKSRTNTFSEEAGETTVNDILSYLEEGKKVIIDTSNYSDSIELLIGSIISHEILYRYKNYKMNGLLDQKPVISIILEEAPRVLGATVANGNIFGTIAREGRKFKVGLTAITQLSSVIPREILANMNTKIILGNEMAPERKAIIESAAQDLSSDDRTIASLDIGEAIVSSNFTKFAVPIQIPLFEEIVEKKERKKIAFTG
jgi:hypothetical protein